MTQEFTSVTAFYNAVRDLLTDTAGLTVERTLALRDLILTDGAEVHVRLLHSEISTTVSAVCMYFGVNADTLEVTQEDPLCCFPFDTSAPGAVSAVFSWTADPRRFYVLLLPGEGSPAGGQFRRYKVWFDFEKRTRVILHLDHTRPQFEPNFRQTSGPYIESGA